MKPQFEDEKPINPFCFEGADFKLKIVKKTVTGTMIVPSSLLVAHWVTLKMTNLKRSTTSNTLLLTSLILRTSSPIPNSARLNLVLGKTNRAQKVEEN